MAVVADLGEHPVALVHCQVEHLRAQPRGPRRRRPSGEDLPAHVAVEGKVVDELAERGRQTFALRVEAVPDARVGDHVVAPEEAARGRPEARRSQNTEGQLT